MGTALLVFQGINLVGTVLPSTVDAALKIKAIFDNAGGDFTVQLQAVVDGELKSAQETVALVDEWKKAHGLK